MSALSRQVCAYRGLFSPLAPLTLHKLLSHIPIFLLFQKGFSFLLLVRFAKLLFFLIKIKRKAALMLDHCATLLYSGIKCEKVRFCVNFSPKVVSVGVVK